MYPVLGRCCERVWPSFLATAQIVVQAFSLQSSLKGCTTKIAKRDGHTPVSMVGRAFLPANELVRYIRPDFMRKIGFSLIAGQSGQFLVDSSVWREVRSRA